MTVEALVTRRAPLSPSGSTTFDPTTRTMRAVIAAGAGVERYDARGAYTEILDHRGMALPVGCTSVPLLNAHARGELSDVLGSATDIAARGDVIEATLTLSRRDDVAPIAQDIADGHVRGVSIGYRVLERSEKADAAGRRVVTATNWELAEVSLTPVPADPKALIRSEAPMPENTPAPVTTTAAAPVATRAQINGEIRALAAPLGLPQSWVDAQIDAEATTEQARASALDEVIRRSATTSPIQTARATVVRDHSDPAQIRAAMADALAHRMSPGRVKLEGRASDFRGVPVLDMVADAAAARGERINTRDRGALAERALTTSDFPGLLADAGNKVLLAAYVAATPTYRQWAAQRPFVDFKAHKFLRAGDFPAFQPTAETGELTYGSIGENKETVTARQLDTGIIISRQALANDDLSAFGDFAIMIAARAAADENAKAYAVLAAATLADGKALFHADHGNLAASGADIATGLDAAVAALRAMKGLDGLPLNIAPRFLIVGPAREAAARRAVADITPAKAADVNPWAGAFEVVVDAGISGNAWHLAADPSSIPSIVYGYVGGSSGPEIRTEVDFDTRSVKVAAGLDFAVGAIDFRGLYKNTGA